MLSYQLNKSIKIKEIIVAYCFLNEYDYLDTDFLMLAKHLLGKPVKKSGVEKILNIKYPLRHLFNSDARISDGAFTVHVEDIKVAVKK